MRIVAIAVAAALVATVGPAAFASMETNLLGEKLALSVCRDGAPGYTLSVEDGKVFNSGDVNGTYWFTTSFQWTFLKTGYGMTCTTRTSEGFNLNTCKASPVRWEGSTLINALQWSSC